MNVLDAVFARYQTVVDSLTIVADIQEQNQDATVQGKIFQGTRFLGEPVDNVRSLLKDSRSDFEDLTVVSLVASFERLIFEHLGKRKFKAASKGLKDVHVAIAKFKFNADDKLFEEVDNLCTYRDWVAHGKRFDLKVPSAVPPITYRRLSEFLKRVGIYK